MLALLVPAEGCDHLFRASRLASGGLLTIFSIPCLVSPMVSAFIFTWHSRCVRVSVQISPFSKDISHTGLGPTHMTSA